MDLPEKRIFCIIKQGKKTREVTSPGPWPLIGSYMFFFVSFDLLCVNLETKVSSQLSSNCNIWWHGEAEEEVRGGIRTVDSQFSYSKVNHGHWYVFS